MTLCSTRCGRSPLAGSDVLDWLEREGRGSFVYRMDDATATLALEPAHLSPEQLLEALTGPLVWAEWVGWPPTSWAALAGAHAAWTAWAGLPEPGNAARLGYLMGRYAAAVEADFARTYPGVDPWALWQSRRWRRLLNLIDHLPSGSAYAAATTTDEEYVEMLAAAGVRRSTGPPPAEGWTAEIAMLALLVDHMQVVANTIVSANLKEGATAPKFVAHPRPRSAWDAVEREQRQVKHRRVVALFAPEGRGEDPPAPVA